MKPHDIFDITNIDIIATDPDKRDLLVWSCTEEQGNDWEEIKRRVTNQGYSSFEKRIVREINELYWIE